jgi:shikimate kinase
MKDYILKNGNIILTGMAGAGKSTIGVLLAKRLGMDFVDTDILIQQKDGRLLQEILDADGVDRFLEIEETVVSGLCMSHCVIATGGSVVYSDKTMTALGKEGKIFYLYVPYNELIKRLTNISTRGIVIRNGSTIRDVYDERLPLYKKYSDLTVDCSGSDIETCVNKIIQFWEPQHN